MLRPLPANSEVFYVNAEGQTKKATIIEQITPGSARLALTENDTAIASHSANGEIGTFHFADEKPAVKDAKAENGGKAPKPFVPGETAADKK